MQPTALSTESVAKIKSDLAALDEHLLTIDGKQVKSSQYYHVELAPVHMLFNTNCPDKLKDRCRKFFRPIFRRELINNANSLPKK
jgi:hypothetical protein